MGTQHFNEQLAIVFAQKVPMPGQVQQPHRWFQVIVFQRLVGKMFVGMGQHGDHTIRSCLLSGGLKQPPDAVMWAVMHHAE